jgi:hypothetical protein
MTDPPAEDGDGPDGDFLTVEQVARLRQVTPAAVRAQLRSGNLAGEQVLQGQRTVWRIPVHAVRDHLAEAGDASPTARRAPAARTAGPPAAPRPGAPVTPPRREPEPEPIPEPQPEPPAVGRGAPREAVPVPLGRVEALESEVRRLRRRLAALAEAHRRLLDAVTADLTDDL